MPRTQRLEAKCCFCPSDSPSFIKNRRIFGDGGEEDPCSILPSTHSNQQAVGVLYKSAEIGMKNRKVFTNNANSRQIKTETCTATNTTNNKYTEYGLIW
uniref:Uncharacterized protein n=1 Tax=Globodera rostochiensis TaxID=31243 RepID=A0A914IDK4_GLORO